MHQSLNKINFIGLFLLVLGITGCNTREIQPIETTPTIHPLATQTQAENLTASTDSAKEVAVQIIPLAGPIADARAEISGMAWHGDHLVLLPQFPARFDNQLFQLEKADIEAYLQGLITQPLTPEPVSIQNADLRQRIQGFEGYEAIAFYQNQVFLTIESKPSRMLGYLQHGTITPDSDLIVLDDELQEIEPQAPLANYSDESILVFQDHIFTLYEANGANVNPAPVAHVFSLQGVPLEPVLFPTIEYRITDTSAPDQQGRFWAINYLFPLDAAKLKPAEDELAGTYGRGTTHAQNQAVERLVQFLISDQGIELVQDAPIQLELTADLVSRNWEGLVVLENYGFLVATDKFPQTLLGFIPWDFSD